MFSLLWKHKPAMESNSTTKCVQDPHPLPIRKVCFSTFLDLVLDFFLFCNATCAHSCLKSPYFLPFLNPRNNRRTWQKQKSAKQSFFYSRGRLPSARRLYKTAYFSRLSLVKLFVFRPHSRLLLWRFACAFFPEKTNNTKKRKGDNG